MLIQHVVVVWNLVFLDEAYSGSLVKIIGSLGAYLFLVIVGTSGYLSHTAKETELSFSQISQMFLIRGLSLLGWGLVISVVTFLFLPQDAVLFGVLSLIGFSTVLLPYFIRYRSFAWFILFTAPVLSWLVSTVFPGNMYLFIFNSYPEQLSTLDYWPIFPWISLVLIGLEIGRRLSSSENVEMPQNILLSAMTYVGRHTLAVYLLHIPILYVLFSSIKYLVF
jgi:uncharacterized membrane protein